MDPKYVFNGITSTNMARNMGVMSLGAFIGLILVAILVIVFVKFRHNTKLKGVLSALWHTVFYSTFIRYGLQAYLSITLNAYI